MHTVVFVVDDEQVIRTAIVKRLIRQGHFATGYESGEVLLQELEHKLPELVLLDLKMPASAALMPSSTCVNLLPPPRHYADRVWNGAGRGRSHEIGGV